jgi:hypothetical protein
MEDSEKKSPENAKPKASETASVPQTSTPPTKFRKTSKGAPKKKAHKTKGGARPPRKFPAYTLEDALQIPKAIKQFNAGNPWPPSEIGKALKIGSKTNRFWYLMAAAQDYGLTTGTSRSQRSRQRGVGAERNSDDLHEAAEEEMMIQSGRYLGFSFIAAYGQGDSEL